MPVLAKLSLRFYEVLGEDVADQMVEWFNQVGEAYRADWRRFYDARVGHSDAALEQRLARLELDIDRRMARFQAEVTAAIRDFRYETAREHRALESSIAAMQRALAACLADKPDGL